MDFGLTFVARDGGLPESEGDSLADLRAVHDPPRGRASSPRAS